MQIEDFAAPAHKFSGVASLEAARWADEQDATAAGIAPLEAARWRGALQLMSGECHAGCVLERQILGQTDRQTKRQTNNQSDRQTDGASCAGYVQAWGGPT